MRFWKKTVLGTATLSLAMACLSGLGSMAPVLAGDAPESIDSNLLPADVLETALAEEAAIPQSVTDPADNSGEPKPVVKALSELVASNLSRTPGSREEECLAVAVYYESKGETLAGQLAVAEVILNRAASRRFASTICGVVTQPSQFSFVRGGRMPAVNRESRDWQEAVAIARIATDELAESGVGNALYFHARRVSPGWSMTRVAAIGNHIFYR
jgi:N-acetylmuramoyl-L-alanine amidase